MKNNITKLGVLCALGVSAVSGCIIANKTNTPIIEEANAATSLETYYANADTSSKLDLISSLKTITSTGYKSIAYTSLKTNAYPTTEATTGDYICDYYQKTYNYTIADAGSGASKVGGGWNKEHTIPQSYWGGGTDNNTQGCDCIIVLPTDIKCNSTRSNYPYGETNASPFSSDSDCKLGTSTFSGYTGTVFEPLDEYKGDIARIYLYAICRWDGYKFTQGTYGGISFSGSLSTNYGLTTYMLNLLKKWHENDPVSDWEVLHNNRVQQVQGNRNPFIDHPEWADWIWFGGSLEEDDKVLTSLSKSGTPSKTTYTAGQSFDPTGVTVTATYDDGTTATVTNSVSWTPNPLTQGTTSVTGTYTYKGVSKTVTVSGLTVNAAPAKTLTSISISGQKTSYKVGDTFVKPTVTAHYSDGTTANVTSSATFTGFDSSEVGEYTITVTYQDKAYDYVITVSEKSGGTGTYTLVESTADLSAGDEIVIASNSNSATAGTISNNIMASVTSSFSNDYSEITSLGEDTVEFTLEKEGDQWALNSSNGYLAIKEVKKVIFQQSPYYFNISVYSGTATITDDTDANGSLQYNAKDPRFTTYTSTQTSIQLYAKPAGGGTSEDPELDHIEVVSPKTNYTVGDTFVEPTVVAYYTNETYTTVTGASFTGYNMSVAGTYTVVVTYESESTAYDITVASVPSADHGKTINDPLTVSEMINKIDGGDDETYYLKALISQVAESYTSQYKNVTLWVTDDENVTQKFQIHRMSIDETNGNAIQVGDTIIVHGKGVLYSSTTYEMAKSDVTFDELITIEEKATAYAEEFNDANVCGTNDNTSAIASVWAEMKSAYDALDSYTREYLTDANASEQNNEIKECLNRYDRVIELHGEDTTHFPNYMNRTSSANSRMIEMKSNDSLLIVAMMLLIGATFTYCVLTFRKKKYQK